MKRSRFTEGQIIGILKEHQAGLGAKDLCRKHGVSDASIYKWKARYGGLDVSEAKRLKQRVRSYFRAYGLPSLRIAAMVAQIADIEYIVTDSELEALILEATLIKKHLPPYNVVLKDDKNFPYITLTIQEEFPRIFTVRKFRQDGALSELTTASPRRCRGAAAVCPSRRDSSRPSPRS